MNINPFNKLKKRVGTFEIVLDAVIGVLIKKQVLTRTEIQKQILADSPTNERKDG